MIWAIEDVSEGWGFFALTNAEHAQVYPGDCLDCGEDMIRVWGDEAERCVSCGSTNCYGAPTKNKGKLLSMMAQLNKGEGTMNAEKQFEALSNRVTAVALSIIYGGATLEHAQQIRGLVAEAADTAVPREYEENKRELIQLWRATADCIERAVEAAKVRA